MSESEKLFAVPEDSRLNEINDELRHIFAELPLLHGRREQEMVKRRKELEKKKNELLEEKNKILNKDLDDVEHEDYHDSDW